MNSNDKRAIKDGYFRDKLTSHDPEMIKLIEGIKKKRKENPWSRPIIPPGITPRIRILRVPTIPSEVVKLIKHHEDIIEAKNQMIREMERQLIDQRNELDKIKDQIKSNDFPKPVEYKSPFMYNSQCPNPKCGFSITDKDANFCPQCGTSIGWVFGEDKWWELKLARMRELSTQTPEPTIKRPKKWRIDHPVFEIGIIFFLADILAWLFTFELWNYYNAPWLVVLDTFLAVLALPFLCNSTTIPTRRGMRIERQKCINKANHRENVKGIKARFKEELAKENSRYHVNRDRMNCNRIKYQRYFDIEEGDINFTKFPIAKYAHYFNRGQLEESAGRGFTTIEDLRRFIQTENVSPTFKSVVLTIVGKIVEDENIYWKNILEKGCR
jgi:hypothetical protein